jgi:hypothetical protein
VHFSGFGLGEGANVPGNSCLLRRAQDPFGKLVVKARRGVRIGETAIFGEPQGD